MPIVMPTLKLECQEALMLDKLLAKVAICPHTAQQIMESARMPGMCPICSRGKFKITEKLIRSYEKMTSKLSDLIATVPGLKGTTLTDAVARLAARTNTAEADLKIATSPKAMEARGEAKGMEAVKSIVNQGLELGDGKLSTAQIVAFNKIVNRLIEAKTKEAEAKP